MAEHVKLRLAAAKVGVSMALLGLLAGLADKARAATPRGHAAAAVASVPGVSSFLKLDKLYVKLNTAIQKVDTALETVQHKLATDYLTAHKIDALYLKIKSADADFVLTSVANLKWLTITDANAEFLQKQSTAADSSKLGGLPASSYGQIASGALTITGNSPSQTLLQMPGTTGAIIVVCKPVVGGGTDVSIQNTTTASVPAVQDTDGKSTSITLAAGATTSLAPQGGFTGGVHQLSVQTFPAGGFNQVLTLTVSLEPSGGAGNVAVVGQILNGNANG